MKTFILASASPRRSDILSQIRVPFRVEPSSYAEDGRDFLPADRPLRFAEGKALDVSRKFPAEYVLGFDTLVFLDGVPLGKPHDAAEALRMLESLNGRSHKVVSGVALAHGGNLLASDGEETVVRFRRVSRKELERYVESGEPMDKAGAYGIQGRACVFVSHLSGDYFTVMGLPMCTLYEMLRVRGLLGA